MPLHAQQCTGLIPVGILACSGTWHCGHVTWNHVPQAARPSVFTWLRGTASMIYRLVARLF